MPWVRGQEGGLDVTWDRSPELGEQVQWRGSDTDIQGPLPFSFSSLRYDLDRPLSRSRLGVSLAHNTGHSSIYVKSKKTQKGRENWKPEYQGRKDREE